MSFNATMTRTSETSLLIERHFAATPKQVFEAWTTPEHIWNWWAGERGTMLEATVNLEVGGTWRYVMTANNGFEVAFSGEFLEIVANERIVNTELFEALQHAPSTNTITFSPADGGTAYRCEISHATASDCTMHLESGMEAGMNEALDRLEAIAAQL